MQEFPLVSVVIPFYSSLKGLLVKSVCSALNQSYSNVEVIVVDDCSPLSASKELSNVKDERLKVIWLKENVKGGIARNIGVEAAVGKFVAFLDYDDVWNEDKIEKQYRLFEQLTQERVSTNFVLYSQALVAGEGYGVVRPIRSIAKNEAVGDYLFVGKQLIQTSSIFLTRSLALEAKFDDIPRHQDYQFCLTLEAIGARFYMLPEATYSFFQIPKLNSYKYSLWWLENYQSYLSPEAKRAFSQGVVIRSMVSAGDFRVAAIYAFKNKFTRSFLLAILVRLIKSVMPSFALAFIRSFRRVEKA